MLEPVSLKALPNPEAEPLPSGAGATGLLRTSKQLPVFSSGTAELPFRASKQLPLFSGSGALTGLDWLAGTAAFGLANSGLNWNPPSLSEGGAVVLLLLLLLLPSLSGSGSLNLKLFRDLEAVLDPAPATSSLVGDENLYTLLLLLLVVLGATVFGLSPVSTALETGNWMSNLGTDFSPASCTSGRLTCGTGALLPRSVWDSSRIRCNLLRILLVCLTLLLVSSDSALGSLYWVGSFRIVLPLDSVAIRRADSVLVWRRFICSN